ncbi:MAG TPA: helix-turn-helix domain-containing protein [Edaphobacter sp.]|nr:helix-turn-helix domain-containing protein [Edaphobacter sp.]
MITRSAKKGTRKAHIVNDPLLNVDEAAEELGMSPKTIRNWIALEQIEFVKVGDSKFAPVRIRKSVVDAKKRKGTKQVFDLEKKGPASVSVPEEGNARESA